MQFLTNLKEENCEYKHTYKFKHKKTGLLIIRGEKSQISPDFWRQIRREKTADFAGIFGANFRRKTKKKAKKKDSRK